MTTVRAAGTSPAGSIRRVATAGEATCVPARSRRGVREGEARAGTRVTGDRDRARPGEAMFQKPIWTRKRRQLKT